MVGPFHPHKWCKCCEGGIVFVSCICTIDSNSSVCCHLHGNMGALVLRRGVCANRFYGCLGDHPFDPTQLATLAWRAVARRIYLVMTWYEIFYFLMCRWYWSIPSRAVFYARNFSFYELTARRLLPFCDFQAQEILFFTCLWHGGSYPAPLRVRDWLRLAFVGVPRHVVL